MKHNATDVTVLSPKSICSQQRSLSITYNGKAICEAQTQIQTLTAWLMLRKIFQLCWQFKAKTQSLSKIHTYGLLKFDHLSKSSFFRHMQWPVFTVWEDYFLFPELRFYKVGDLNIVWSHLHLGLVLPTYSALFSSAIKCVDFCYCTK